MSQQTKIAWTDSTWSPWRGCTHATLPDGSEHLGCQHCYAEALSKRNHRVLGTWGQDGSRVVNADWQSPLKWNRRAAEQYKRFSEYITELDMPCPSRGPDRPRVFPSLCDVFESFEGWVLDHHGDVILEGGDLYGGEAWTLDDARREFFRLIDATPHIDWLLLTKRPGNVMRMWPRNPAHEYVAAAGVLNDWPMFHRSNVWIGTSVSDQTTADELIQELLKLRELVPVLFVSVEPMLGPVDLSSHLASVRQGGFSGRVRPGTSEAGWQSAIDWVIIGGESGPSARPCDVEWIRGLVHQCRKANVPCFVKQLGARPVDGAHWRGKAPVEHYPPLDFDDRKGGDPAEWPEDLRVQEFPAR